MKIKLALAAAALALAPAAFAQSAVTSSSGTTVTSGTGVVVTPGVSAVVPAGTAVTTVHLIPGATTVAMGPAVVNTTGNTTTTVTRYWANVPANVTADADFQRWQRLK